MPRFSDQLREEWDKLSAGNASFNAEIFILSIKTLVDAGELTPDFAARMSPTLLQSRIPGAAKAGLDLLRSLAEKGDASAMLNLGVALWAGHGGPAKPVEACHLFEQLIAQPSLDDATRGGALAQLAQGYRDGAGVPQDLDRAVCLFERAAALGVEDAAYCAGLICQGEAEHKFPSGSDYTRAAQAYAMNMDDVRCQTNLGLLHLRSLAPDNNFELGMNLLETAAQRGDSEAISALVAYETVGRHALAVLEKLGYARRRGRARH